MKSKYRIEVEEIVRGKYVLEGLLILLRRMYTDYLSGKATLEDVLSVNDYWYAACDEFSDYIIRINHKVKDIGSAGIDLGAPAFSEERRKRIVKEILKRIEEILKRR